MVLKEATHKFDLDRCGSGRGRGPDKIFGDTLLPKVFYNLIDNSLEHGEKVSRISIRAEPLSGGDINVIYRDDGVGISEETRGDLFERKGKSASGLALAQDILSITGLTIQEVGEKGNGAEFEIIVPNGYYRGRPDRGNEKNVPRH